MGNKIIQRIYTCDLCDKISEDGEPLWHMCQEVWCKGCCDKADNEPEKEE